MAKGIQWIEGKVSELPNIRDEYVVGSIPARLTKKIKEL
jgi:hypothetical protein